ncbi:MAG TPA: hypothetical protein VG367_11810 [Mucilaginibacter sp.]|jgi:hypothetical protein|nr:hypothetical protein [Mucilaginibacter sp.]
MKKGLLPVLFFGVFCFWGCKKEHAVTPAGDNYLPVTEGSTWKYSYSSDGGATDTLTLKMIGGTTQIKGKTYYNALSTYKQGSSQGYFYTGNHVYSTRSIAIGASVAMEFQLLNDTASVGYRWISSPTDDGMLGGKPARTVNTIIEKNISRTINGTTFSNVSHTQVQLQYDLGSGFETTVTYDFYLAKGIGLIENDSNTLDTFYETETLFNYTIK